MQILDFEFTETLDLKLEDGEFSSQSHGETSLITAIYTNARIRNTAGYWLDVNSSEVWTLQQSRLTQDVATKMVEYVRTTTQKLVKQGLFSRIDVSSDISSGKLGLLLQCYDDDKLIVIDRKYFI